MQKGSVVEYYKSKKDCMEGKLQGRIDIYRASSQASDKAPANPPHFSTNQSFISAWLLAALFVLMSCDATTLLSLI